MDRLQELMLSTGCSVVYSGSYDFEVLKGMFIALKEKDYKWINGDEIKAEASAEETLERCVVEKLNLIIEEDKEICFGSVYDQSIKLNEDNIVDLLRETGLNREEKDVLFALKILKNHCEKRDECMECILKKDRGGIS